jgi:hypothetical protein
MESLMSLLQVLNSLSPLAVIALLAVIIFMMVQQNKGTAKQEQVNEIRDNHLHDLPQMLETLQRIEVKLGEEFAFIRAKLSNGGKAK